MIFDYNCPQCEAKNSVEVDRASVKGNTIEVGLACKKCGVQSPFIQCDIETIDMRRIYSNWYVKGRKDRKEG